MSQEWLNNFKLAVIQEDEDLMEKLINIDFSNFSKDELIEASALIKEASTIFYDKKRQLNIEMTKLKQVKKYTT